MAKSKVRYLPRPITEVEQVFSAKLLGVTLCETLRFDIHVGNVLKLCSQRIYLLKLLRDQGLPRFHLNTIFDALVLSRLRYAISAWSGFLSAELKGNINSFLKRSYKYGFCTGIYTIELLAQEADRLLFTEMASDQHCIHFLLPDIKSSNYCLRPKGHAYQLPRCDYKLHKRSFIPRCLFSYV